MRLVPVASDGWRFILPLMIVALACFLSPYEFLLGLGVLCAAASLFCIFFFRDFNRKTPIDEGVIYSPGDGKILEVADTTLPDGSEGKIIRVFLSVLDGHVQRSPVQGLIEKVEYKKGRFYDARDPRAHLENEQNGVTIATPKGKLIVNQIAGLLARRIVCWIKAGDQVGQGQRYGLIRFGSQVDVLVPKETEICVVANQRVKGGESIIGRW